MSEKFFGFRVSTNDKKFKEFVNYLESKPNTAGFLRDLAYKYSRGELFEQDEEDLKFQKLRADIEFKKVCTEIKKKELAHWNTFDKPPSNAASKAIKKGTENSAAKSVSIYNGNAHRLECPDCDVTIEFAKDESDLKEAKIMFVDHYYKIHGEMPAKLETELAEIE